jgi:hypothetical protein
MCFAGLYDKECLLLAQIKILSQKSVLVLAVCISVRDVRIDGSALMVG